MSGTVLAARSRPADPGRGGRAPPSGRSRSRGPGPAIAAGGVAAPWRVAPLYLAVAGRSRFCDRVIPLRAGAIGLVPGAPMPRPIPFDLQTGETT